MAVAGVPGSGPRPTLVIGRGLLGSAVARSLTDPRFVARPIRWGQPDAVADVRSAVDLFLGGLGEQQPTAIAWCAGSGTVGTSAASLQMELDALAALCGVLARSGRPGRLFLASSAGGVYAGSGASTITEHSEPRPTSPYGRARLDAEHLAASALAGSGTRLLVGRISNLYGPDQRLNKPQGAISQLLRSVVLREPFVMHVSAETQRDYIDADSAGRRIARWLSGVDSLARSDDPSADRADTATKLIVSGRVESLSRLAAVVFAVTGVRPRVVLARNAQSAMQPRSIRFRSVVQTELDRDVPVRSLEEGIGVVWRHLLAQYRRSGPRSL